MKSIVIKVRTEELTLLFNMYAKQELYKCLFENPFANPEMGELLDKINEVLNENQMLFYRSLIYAGLCGYDFSRGKLKPSKSIAEVSEMVGEISPDEMSEFFYGIWQTFFDTIGMNLEKLTEAIGEGEKKK